MTIQLVLSRRPKTSALDVVLSFDMTQNVLFGLKRACGWLRKGDPVLDMKLPCRARFDDMVRDEGSAMPGHKEPLTPRRVAK